MTDITSDIRFDSWLVSWVTPSIRPYLLLMRLDRPIGTWLLLYPCWWGLALAPGSKTVGLHIWYGALFAIASILMRGIACTVNDILDRDLDARVARTRSRPIPNGDVSPLQAFLFTFFQILLTIPILLQFNHLTVVLAIIALILLFIYPLMKRITWWPQAFLGVAFNWGVLGGWVAVTGHLAAPAVILYVAGIFWTLGYDTIYALQDVEDDTSTGIRSTARLFGKHSRSWVGGFYVLTILLIGVSGIVAHLATVPFLVLLVLASIQLGWQYANLAAKSPSDCLSKFRSNRWFGLLLLLCLIVARIVKQ